MKDSQSVNWRTKQKKKRYFIKKKPNPNVPKKSGIIYRAKPKKDPEFSSFSSKYSISLQLFLIPVILLSILSIIYVVNSAIKEKVNKAKLSASQDTKVLPYPVVVNLYEPYLSSKAAIVQDVGSQKIIYSKNAELRFSMASTVKIMTALVSLDYYQPNSILTIKSGAIEGSGIDLKIGDQFYFIDLLYAMLLPSANDAAAAIADNYPLGREAFIAKMNEKAIEFHLLDTHFGDPVGLDDDANYTTVVDLARLGSMSLNNDQLASIVGTQQKFIRNVTDTKEYNLTNLNKLLGTSGVNGIKTGTTEGAGEVLVTSANINNSTYIIVVMNSQNRFLDTQNLLSLVTNNITYITPSLPVNFAN